MKASDRESLWQRLCATGLAEGDMPAATAVSTPWYVRLMLGIAGWIGAWFFIGFLGTAFVLIFRHGAATIGLGALCCAGAYALFRMAREQDFVPQFGLAVSLAGQILVVAGLFNLMGEHFNARLYLLIAAFEIGLVVLIAHFVHRVWSTVAAAIALSLAIGDLGAYSVHGLAASAAAAVFAGIWLNEHVWVTRGALWRPVGYGVAFALLWFDGFTLAARALASADNVAGASAIAVWVGPAVAGAVLIYAVYRLLGQHDVSSSSPVGIAALAATSAVAILTIGAPGVAVSLLILIVGFAGGHRTLAGVGVAALLGYLFWFYYSLHATLLVKSAVLAATGLVLIASWAGVHVLVGDTDREGIHA